MTRTGYSKDQQHQVKQLIFECSLAKMSSFQTQQVLKEKLDVNVTTGWINKIKAQFKEDARREYYRLLTDNFAYKYLTMEIMLQMHEIIKQQWDIANTHKGKGGNNNDLIALKALSEVRESVLRVSDFYKFLPEVENNLLTLRVSHNNSNNYSSSNSRSEDFDKIDIDKEDSLSEAEKELLRKGTATIVGRDISSGELIIDDNPDFHFDDDDDS
jgi:hypothetical protein